VSVPANPPAFPTVVPLEFQFAHDGMTLRDWFAGQALSGMAANAEVDAVNSEMALIAYSLADAMLAQRTQAVS